MLHHVSDPSYHDLSDVTIDVPETHRILDGTLHLRLIFLLPCPCMFGVHTAQGYRDLLNAVLAARDLLLNRCHGGLWHHNRDGYLKRGSHELLVNSPYPAQVHGFVPGVQNGHHLSATLEVLLEDGLEVLTAHSFLFDNNSILVINKKAHKKEHVFSCRSRMSTQAVHPQCTLYLREMVAPHPRQEVCLSSPLIFGYPVHKCTTHLAIPRALDMFANRVRG
mmetsp:Transcript_15624/g.36878  ORF Transcript_15624/g.36878 Transcript_15624/m.36878 type:complete len:221 (+) Transcript_15624:252-914(+)